MFWRKIESNVGLWVSADQWYVLNLIARQQNIPARFYWTVLVGVLVGVGGAGEGLPLADQSFLVEKRLFWPP